MPGAVSGKPSPETKWMVHSTTATQQKKMVLMTAAVSHKRGAVAKAIPGAVIATIGVAMAVGGESLDMQEAVRNIASNPLPYVLAFVGAFIWAIYATFTPSLSGGYDGTTIFRMR